MSPATKLIVVVAGHVLLRFGGLWSPPLVPLSMVWVWPTPWLLSDRADRRAVGFRLPAPHWFPIAGLVGIVLVAVCAGVAWGPYGSGANNWFARHAVALGTSAEGIPAGATLSQVFWFLTIPAMIFSALAEEILFRGYLMRAIGRVHGPNAGLIGQGAAFALIHLAHYGLSPFQPLLIPVWLASMFGVGLTLGLLVRRSGSLWPAMLAHAVFNLLMNVVSFTAFSDAIARPS
jgi:membrane protease YdiL (CAAX protease family)